MWTLPAVPLGPMTVWEAHFCAAVGAELNFPPGELHAVLDAEQGSVWWFSERAGLYVNMVCGKKVHGRATDVSGARSPAS